MPVIDRNSYQRTPQSINEKVYYIMQDMVIIVKSVRR